MVRWSDSSLIIRIIMIGFKRFINTFSVVVMELKTPKYLLQPKLYELDTVVAAQN